MFLIMLLTFRFLHSQQCLKLTLFYTFFYKVNDHSSLISMYVYAWKYSFLSLKRHEGTTFRIINFTETNKLIYFMVCSKLIRQNKPVPLTVFHAIKSKTFWICNHPCHIFKRIGNGVIADCHWKFIFLHIGIDLFQKFIYFKL